MLRNEYYNLKVAESETNITYGVAQITEENKPPFDNLYAPTLASA